MTVSASSDERFSALEKWAAELSPAYQIRPGSFSSASSDASFRRYFRVDSAHPDHPSLILMDAPPQHEDCRPFLNIASRLQQTGVNVPKILECDLEQGFMLLSDLGRQTYYQRLQAPVDDHTLQTLYRDVLQSLVRMQHADHQGLPAYDSERLLRELTLFEEWYVQRWCGQTLSSTEQQHLQEIYRILSEQITAEQYVFVHRDFHSPNLMLCTESWQGGNPGIIDFQDALSGPLSYDLASLVMDARTTWEEAQQLDWAIRYWEKARDAGLPIPHDFARFHQQYEFVSLQRNLRIAGVFARLALRDNKPHYLDHMPRVKQYIRQVAKRYQVFAPLMRLMDRLDNIQYSSGLTF